MKNNTAHQHKLYISCNYTFLFTWTIDSAWILYLFSITHYKLPWCLQLKNGKKSIICSISINLESGQPYSCLFFISCLRISSFIQWVQSLSSSSIVYPLNLCHFVFDTSRLICVVRGVFMILHWNVVILSQTILYEIGDILEFKPTVSKTNFMVIAGLKIHYFPDHKSLSSLAVYFQILPICSLKHCI